MLAANGNYAGEDEYGDETTPASNDATYVDVQLDGSDQIDTSIYWQAQGADAKKQMAEMETWTPSGNLLGIQTRLSGSANLASKVTDTWTRLHDGTAAAEQQNANLDDTIFRGRHFVWPTAPDGGAWTQTDLNNLKAGVRCVDTNTANNRWAALIVEAFAVDSDPPVAAAAGNVSQAIVIG
jgi:hypothetical protein